MSQSIRVHLRIPGTAPMPQLMRLIQDVEAAGFDGAGILDSQLLSRDAFVVLGQAATHTSRLTLFPAVTNPFTRDASVLASAIQTVEELAPGRVKFVIGTGYTSASTIGRKPATLAQMRACISTVKALLAGQTVDFDGTPGRLGYAAGRHIPVIMAASGPKSIELAGEIADGVLLLVGFNRGIVERALEHLERGAKRAGRRLDDLEIIWAVRTGTAATTEAARRYARPTAVHWGVLRWVATGWSRRDLSFPSSRCRTPCTGSIPICPTPTTGRLRSRRRRSSPTRLPPNSATRSDSSERRPTAPRVSSRWRSSACGTFT